MITRFYRENLAQNLPDAYSKGKQSNNAKILTAEKSASDNLRKSISEMEEVLDIDKAYGKTLDLYGGMLGQFRGSTSDEQYRVLIRNKIFRNCSNADYNSIVKAICATFSCKPSDVILTELDEPCKVRLEGLPISQLVGNNIGIDAAVQIVTGLLPAGVMMEAVDFSGTFEFSGGAALVYDESAGFADDDRTIGGYLGLLSNGTSSGTDSSGGTSSDDLDRSASLGRAVLGAMKLGHQR